MPYRYFIQLAFDGAGFSGWQMQPNALTVQSLIEQGISMIAGVSIGVTGCGRTDAGVHARLFYAHFDVDEPLKNPEQLAFKLNRFLPPSIAIKAIVPVIPGSHSRFSAIWREYRYTLISKKDPFLFSRASLVAGTLDLDLMNRGAQLLLEYPDFECFSKVKTQVSNFNCRILEAEWMAIDHVMEFHIRADRFLRNMVRAIVGTLLDIGRHKLDLEDMRNIILSHDRRKAGVSVAAKGLILWEVVYPDEIFCEVPVWFSYDNLKEIISHGNTDPKFHQGSGNETDE